MNIVQRKEKYLKIAQYLCTPLYTKEDGKKIYPSLEQAASIFGYCATHIFRVKKQMVTIDEKGERGLING